MPGPKAVITRENGGSLYNIQHEKKTIKLLRDDDDTLFSFFQRLLKKVHEPTDAERKKSRLDPPVMSMADTAKMGFWTSEGVCVGESSESESLLRSKRLKVVVDAANVLKIADISYQLVKYPAIPSTLNIPSVPMVAKPVQLTVNPSLENLSITWYTSSPSSIPRASKKKPKSKLDSIKEVSKPDLSALQCGFGMGNADPAIFGVKRCEGETVYYPKEEDLGMYCIAKVSMVDCPEYFAVVISPTPTEKAPPLCEWNEKRFEDWPSKPTPPSFRVATWNLLAPVYAGTAFAQSALFPYCSPNHIAYSYRRNLLAADIDRIDADIFCFQECSVEVYEDLVEPLCSHRSMNCMFFQKISKAAEGLAITYRHTRWQEVDRREIVFKTTFLGDTYYQGLRERLDQLWPNFLQHVIPQMSTVYLLCALENLDDQSLTIVGNSHFYFHPKASHIRALQAYVMTVELEKMRQHFLGTYARVDLIVAGDFNADDRTATIDLLETGIVPHNHISWTHAKHFGIGTRNSPPADELTPSPNLIVGEGNQNYSSEGPRLKSSLKLKRGMPSADFTTHVGQFFAVLDWIFLSPELEVERFLPTPKLHNIAHVHGHTIGGLEGVLPGIPTASYPSDHIPVVLDVIRT